MLETASRKEAPSIITKPGGRLYTSVNSTSYKTQSVTKLATSTGRGWVLGKRLCLRCKYVMVRCTSTHVEKADEKMVRRGEHAQRAMGKIASYGVEGVD
jgi:hypothetical protein